MNESIKLFKVNKWVKMHDLQSIHVVGWLCKEYAHFQLLNFPTLN